MFHLRSALLGAAGLMLLALAVGLAIAASGLYDVAADAPHAALARGFLTYARERSIDVRAASVRVPALNDSRMIADGASDYREMCTACHLAPGMRENEMRPGLNPQPPLLASGRGDAAEQFWIVKHGIKMTGMPAWGLTHTDAEIWNIVAFLQKLPSLSPLQYEALTHAAAGHHDHDMEMNH